METQVKENGQAKGAGVVAVDNTQKNVAKNPVSELNKDMEEKQNTKPQALQAANLESKSLEIKAAPGHQLPALNLEQTLKKIKELNRFSIQREKLIGTIDKLEDFEILQLDQAEETNLNHFQRCELRLTDDNGNVFTTKNPFIIDQVSKNIKSLCLEKLTEVEAHIFLNL